MDMEKLFWQIFNAQNESELHEIVQRNTLFNNENNWFPYGGKDKDDRGNFGTFENQQANPIPALIEKVTNSIDALLLKQCKIKGIDPTSDKAPRTMAAAVEDFFEIKNGDFSEISQKGRRSIAEDIQIIAEGDKQAPNLIIYDNGEGQHPDDFKDTFLSISRCNKTKIQFVQGKYNMGSTGAVIFCGEYRYQLIASKQCDSLNRRKSNEFGFTLVRKHPLSEYEEGHLKSSWYEYFTINGQIPKFQIKELDLGLYERKFKTGSVVKLYSYGLPRGSRSNVTWDIWRDLNQFLYHPALPFIVYEKRWPQLKTPSKVILGNKIRLVLDDRDKKEKTITISITDNAFGDISIEIHVLNLGVDYKEFVNGKSVIFTLNGQVQGSLPRTYVSQELGYSMLRDSMLVQVDCTKMKTSFRIDLFKGSRDRLNEGNKTELLLDKITAVLRDNEELRALNQNRKNKILRESTEDKNLLSEVLANLPIDNEILNLLKNNEDFKFFKKDGNINRIDSNKESKIKKYETKRFPSIFKINLKNNGNGRCLKSIPLNGKGLINFETDVEDEYLFRPKEKGDLTLEVLGFNSNNSSGGGHATPTRIEEIFNVTKTGPIDQSIRLTFEPKANLSVGDEVNLKARLSSPDGDLESIFWVKIAASQNDEPKKKEDEEKDQISPPLPIRVFQTKEKEDDRTWEEYGWGGRDIVQVVTGKINNQPAIEAIAVNMDGFVLRKFISKNKITTEEKLKFIKNRYFLSIYLHSLFLYSILSKINKNESMENQIDPDEIIPMIFQYYSGFLLSSMVLSDEQNLVTVD